MDDVKLPFTMTAAVSTADAAADATQQQQPLPPGWVRIPVTIKIMLPMGLVEQPGAAEAPAAG